MRVRDRAKKITAKRQEGYLEGRIGLIIDGTGRDYDKIAKQATELKQIGYDVHMIIREHIPLMLLFNVMQNVLALSQSPLLQNHGKTFSPTSVSSVNTSKGTLWLWTTTMRVRMYSHRSSNRSRDCSGKRLETLKRNSGWHNR